MWAPYLFFSAQQSAHQPQALADEDNAVNKEAVGDR